MRTFSNFALALALLAVSASWLVKPDYAAQAAVAPAYGAFAAPIVTNTLAGCVQPPGVTIKLGVAWCFVLTGSANDKLYFSENGSATWNPYP